MILGHSQLFNDFDLYNEIIIRFIDTNKDNYLFLKYFLFYDSISYLYEMKLIKQVNIFCENKENDF